MGHGNGKASPKNNARSFSETLIRAICEADFEMPPSRPGRDRFRAAPHEEGFSCRGLCWEERLARSAERV